MKRLPMDGPKILKRFAARVGFTAEEVELFKQGGSRLRHLERLAQAAPQYSIVAEVVEAHHCNSGYKIGDRFVLDVDGNFIAKLCPRRLCVYATGQFVVPVALINERLSEGLDPNGFHFMKFVQCPDLGVECASYGRVRFEMKVAPRIKMPREEKV